SEAAPRDRDHGAVATFGRLRDLGAAECSTESTSGRPRPEVVVKLFRNALPLLFCAAAWSAPLAAPAPAPNAAVLRDIAAAEDSRDWASGKLASALSHADPAVRARAVLAVGRLQDTLSIPALLPLLADKVAGVRSDAVFALGQIGHKSARAALEKALDDPDAGVKDNAAEALGKLGDKAATAKLLPLLRTGTSTRKQRVCESLWRLADTSATGALIASCNEKDPAVRWRVVYALEKLVIPARVVPVVTPLLRDPDPLVRAHAARTLGREKSPLATTALMAALDDGDVPLVVNAVRALQSIGDSSVPGLSARLTQLLAHRDPYVRVTAATALADSFVWVGSGTDSLALRSALVHGFDDADFATRGACGRALIVRLHRSGLELARGLFADTSAYTRNAVMDGLRTMRARDLDETPPRVANALSGAFHTDGHKLVRMTAAEVTGVLLGATHHKSLQPMLAVLRKGVGDPDVLISAACSGALADAGDTVSVPLLAAAYATRGHDADADARIGIRDALRTLAGRAYADSVEKAHPAPAPPATHDDEFFQPSAYSRAVLHTSAGDIEWRFYVDLAPQTVKNFVALAKRHYFDGLRVHRV